MKRIFTFLVSALLCTMVMGQAPTAEINKATTAPLIDGLVDEVWATADEIPIDVVMTVKGVAEKPTIGKSWWKALWNKDGIYVLCFIEDDVFVPAYMGTDPISSWMYDKPEIYFDCNYEKKDGIGGGGKQGHYQFAPTEIEALVNGGTATVEASGMSFAYNATDKPNYYVEYFFPYSALLDKAGVQVDQTEKIGFDVNIMDNDILTPSRDRMNWANAGAINENYGNMDDAGTITLKGATAAISVDAITLNTGGTITTDNGTLQMVSTITPTDATNQMLKWTVVNLTGKATVDANGLVKAIKDGTVSVKATSTDGMGAEAMVDIVITGQVVTSLESSYVVDGIFATDGAPLSVWVSENLVSSTIVNGIAEIVPKAVKAAPDTPAPWDNKFRQTLNVPFDLKDTEMIFTFKAWADADRILTVDFEDSKNNYPRYGVSPNGIEGKSDWLINLTTEPTVFTFDVTFSAMLENAVQEMVFMGGMAEAKYYIDNVMLMTKADFALPNAKSFNANSLKLYPNPIDGNNQLTVELASANVKIAIYNAIGQKMMEKISTGNVAKFDVSSLQKGLYFVKLSDGTTQKFIK